jgi:hypothetical protein
MAESKSYLFYQVQGRGRADSKNALLRDQTRTGCLCSYPGISYYNNNDTWTTEAFPVSSIRPCKEFSLPYAITDRSVTRQHE